jgi:hypothetical protein
MRGTWCPLRPVNDRIGMAEQRPKTLPKRVALELSFYLRSDAVRFVHPAIPRAREGDIMMWAIVVFSFIAAGAGSSSTAITTIPVNNEQVCRDQAAVLTFNGDLSGGAPGNSYGVIAKCIQVQKK